MIRSPQKSHRMIDRLVNRPATVWIVGTVSTTALATVASLSSTPEYVWQIPVVGAFIFMVGMLLRFVSKMMADHRDERKQWCLQQEKRDGQWLDALKERDSFIAGMQTELLSAKERNIETLALTKDALLRHADIAGQLTNAIDSLCENVCPVEKSNG